MCGTRALIREDRFSNAWFHTSRSNLCKPLHWMFASRGERWFARARIEVNLRVQIGSHIGKRSRCLDLPRSGRCAGMELCRLEIRAEQIASGGIRNKVEDFPWNHNSGRWANPGRSTVVSKGFEVTGCSRPSLESSVQISTFRPNFDCPVPLRPPQSFGQFARKWLYATVTDVTGHRDVHHAKTTKPHLTGGSSNGFRMPGCCG